MSNLEAPVTDLVTDSTGVPPGDHLLQAGGEVGELVARQQHPDSLHQEATRQSHTCLTRGQAAGQASCTPTTIPDNTRLDIILKQSTSSKFTQKMTRCEMRYIALDIAIIY